MEILSEKINPRDNLSYSLRRYRVWWAILLVSMVFDYLTTLNFISDTGIRGEGNLVIAWLMQSLGVYAGLALAKVLQLIAVVAIVAMSRRIGNLFMIIVILLNCWAVVMNSIPQYPTT